MCDGQPLLSVTVRDGLSWSSCSLFGARSDADARRLMSACHLYEVEEAVLPHEQVEAGVWRSLRVKPDADGRLFVVTDESPEAGRLTTIAGRCQLVVTNGLGRVTQLPFTPEGWTTMHKRKRIWYSGSERNELAKDGSVVVCSNALSAAWLWMQTHRDGDADASDITPTEEAPIEGSAGTDDKASSVTDTRRTPSVAWLHEPRRRFNKTIAYMLRYVAADRIMLCDGDADSRREADRAVIDHPVIKSAALPVAHMKPLFAYPDVEELLQVVARAETVCPFDYVVKRNKKDEIIGTEYRIDSTRIWTYMRCLGYARCTKQEEGGFTSQLVYRDPSDGIVSFVGNSALAEVTRVALNAYAEYVSVYYKWDFGAMRNAVSRSKDISNDGIANLPLVDVNFEGSYGPDLDYFFYQNGCLKITPDAITWHEGYADLPFMVFREQILPFTFQMPADVEARPPFVIGENPEYRERMATYKAHQTDRQHSQDDLDVEQGELTRWAQHHRWKIAFPQSGVGEDGLEDRSGWWPPMAVLRGYANNRWRDEYELNRTGKDFSDEQQGELQAHLANIIWTIGHLLYRYREGVNYISYIMENADIDETKSEGGTGKSTLVNVLCGCAGKVLQIDCRSVLANTEIALKLAPFDPRIYRIIHFEDCRADFPFDLLFNYASNGITYRKFHQAQTTVPVSQSPGIAMTSNYAPTGNDASSNRRRAVCGISHYFYANKHGQGRPITDVLPNLSRWQTEGETEMRSQIAYIAALSVQFCMKVCERVEQPSEMADLRADYVNYGRPFVQFANELLADEKHYGVPLDAPSMFKEYIELCEASDMRKSSYSPRRFRENLVQFAAARNIVVNPDIVYSPYSNDKERGKLPRFQSWVRHDYFTESGFANMQHVVSIREKDNSSGTIWIFRKGQVPKTFDEVRQLARLYVAGPDPEPIRDADGKPVTELTAEQRTMLDNYNIKKMGSTGNPDTPPTPVVAPVKVAPPKLEKVEPDEKLPF